MVGRLARGALDLLVALVADQQDVVVLAGEPLRLVVDLGHQRAGGVDGLELALLGLAVHLGRDAVGGEHHGRAVGHLVELLDEDRAARLEVGDDVLVVHDLLADVDGCAVQVERLLDGDHRAVDAGAVAARRGEQHGLLGRRPATGSAGMPMSVRHDASSLGRSAGRWCSPNLAAWPWRHSPRVTGPGAADRQRDRAAGSTGSARCGWRARSRRSAGGPGSAPSS